MNTRFQLSDINTDTALFQFRSVKFNEERVRILVQNWDASILDPLDVWRSPDGKLYLISGHHRLEAMRRLGIVDAECRVHDVSLDQAQLVALKSNANRLEYTPYELARCMSHLVGQGKSIARASEELSISAGMGSKYYSLRHLIGTDWEVNDKALDLTARAFEIGRLCDRMEQQGKSLRANEIQSLFKVIVDGGLTLPQVKQLANDLSKMEIQHEQGLLFDLEIDRVVGAVKVRQYLDKIAAQTWWLYELLHGRESDKLPPEIRTELEASLCKVHAYCIGAEQESVIPSRAGTSGRKLKVELACK